jgi:hypothetical protein
MSRVEPDRDGHVRLLRVVVRGVSPLVMRRVVVDVNTTLAALDSVLRVVFGCSGLRHKLCLVDEFDGYIARNAASIPNYGERHRAVNRSRPRPRRRLAL